MAPYKYKHLEDSIYKILEGNVTLSEHEKKIYNQYLKQIFEMLEFEMRKDPAFNALYRQKQYVGSFYENLKIDMPDEFDINFELALPSYIGCLEICRSDEPGFCRLKLRENTSPEYDTRKAEAKRQVKSWTDFQGFFSRSEVNEWMQSVVDKALRACEQNYEQRVFVFNRSMSGPAVTLTVTLIQHPELQLSLDFVPVFVFEQWPILGYEQWPHVDYLCRWISAMGEQKWYALPKSFTSNDDFRISFWHQEEFLIPYKNQLKPVLKLVKKLRDDQQWLGFSSYYIKTMFLWKTVANGRHYWQKGLGETFIEMLKEQKNYLLNHKPLPFFWVKGNDLLSQLHPYEKEKIGRFLDRMLRDLVRNLHKPGYLEKYFHLHDRTVRQHYQEDNSCSLSTIAIGAVALFAVGLFANMVENTRRP